MAGPVDLVAAKQNLAAAIGDGMRLYLQILQSWFKQKISREDFDYEARKMLPEDTIPLHNQFLLAILTRCNILGSSVGSRESSLSSSYRISRKRRRESNNKTNFQQRFVPANPLSQAPIISPTAPEQDDKRIGFCSREQTLPDAGLVHGRLLVTAWDLGLDDIDENIVKLVMSAVEFGLKNIISSVLCKKNAYKVREKVFKYSIGSEAPKVYIRNSARLDDPNSKGEATTISSKGVHMPSIKRSVETGGRDASTELACAGEPLSTKHKIGLFDLYDALQVHKSTIPSHTVYATNMERIVNRLNHITNEEYEQEIIHQQEIKLKHDIVSQSIVMQT